MTARQEFALAPRVALAVFLGAFVVRLVNALALAGDPAHFFIEDARLYWDGAGFLLEHGRLDPPPEGAPGRERMPLYFAFLAAVRNIFGAAPVAAVLVQGIVDAGTCVLILKLGALLSPRVGLLAGLFAAMWPNLIVHASALLTETVFLFVFAAMTLMAARHLASGRIAHAAGAGFLCGASILARSVAQFLPFAMAVAAPIAAAVACRPLGRAALAGAAALLGAGAITAPWLVLNWRDHGALAWTTQEGTHVSAWVLPLVRQAVDGTPHADGARLYRDRYLDELRAQGQDPAAMDPFALSRHLRARAMEDLRAMPATALAAAWAKGAAINLAAPAVVLDPRVRAGREASVYNDPTPGLLARSQRYLASMPAAMRPVIALGLAFSALSLALQAWGFCALLRRHPWVAAAAGALLLYVLLVTGPIYSPKYRMPAEPVLIVLAALGAERALSLLRRRRAPM
jgi:hypothetical protein